MLHCCDTFSDSMQSGTDTEEHGPCTRDRQGFYFIGGNDLPSIKFCPWCGADKTKPHPLVVAARNVISKLSPPNEWSDLKDAIGNLEYILEQNHPESAGNVR